MLDHNNTLKSSNKPKNYHLNRICVFILFVRASVEKGVKSLCNSK